jgi:hypothetical protein
MPNYWLGIMAVVLAITLAAWIGLVFRADKYQPGHSRDSATNRDVTAGSLAARTGSVPEQAAGAAGAPDTAGAAEPGRQPATGQAARPAVPGQRTEPVPEQTATPGDRR